MTITKKEMAMNTEHKEYIRQINGADTAVLFIHGILGTPRHFDEFISLIPEQWSIYNILLKGHGGTVDDFIKSNKKQWIEQVDKISHELCNQYKQIIVVGHSMGTLLGIREALRHPNSIKSMILLAVPLRIFVKPVASFNSVRIALNLYKKETPIIAYAKKNHGTTSDRRVWKYLGYIPRFLDLFSLIGEIRKGIKDLKVKTYVFQSKKDELVAYGSKEYLVNHPYIEYDELENSSHYYYTEEDKKKFMNKLIDIFNKL